MSNRGDDLLLTSEGFNVIKIDGQLDFQHKFLILNWFKIKVNLISDTTRF
jgi:hypothetical protein